MREGGGREGGGREGGRGREEGGREEGGMEGGREEGSEGGKDGGRRKREGEHKINREREMGLYPTWMNFISSVTPSGLVPPITHNIT